MTDTSNETVRCHGLYRRCTLRDWRIPITDNRRDECDECDETGIITGHWKGDQSLCHRCDARAIDKFNRDHLEWDD